MAGRRGIVPQNAPEFYEPEVAAHPFDTAKANALLDDLGMTWKDADEALELLHMGGYSLPSRTIREMIISSIDVVVQAARLRDGSRRITHITEVIGMEGDVIVTQELFNFEYLDESEDGKIIGEFRSSGLRPYTLEKARQFGFDQAYLEACL